MSFKFRRQSPNPLPPVEPPQGGPGNNGEPQGGSLSPRSPPVIVSQEDQNNQDLAESILDQTTAFFNRRTTNWSTSSFRWSSFRRGRSSSPAADDGATSPRNCNGGGVGTRGTSFVIKKPSPLRTRRSDDGLLHPRESRLAGGFGSEDSKRRMKGPTAGSEGSGLNDVERAGSAVLERRGQRWASEVPVREGDESDQDLDESCRNLAREIQAGAEGENEGGTGKRKSIKWKGSQENEDDDDERSGGFMSRSQKAKSSSEGIISRFGGSFRRSNSARRRGASGEDRRGSKGKNAENGAGEQGKATTPVVLDDADAPPQNCYRLMILGSARVGKSSIVSRFLHGRYDDNYTPTIEDFHRKVYRIKGETYRLDILDTAGNDPFPAMKRLSLLTGDLFVIVYSIESRESFEESKRLHQQILEAKLGGQGNPGPIVGHCGSGKTAGCVGGHWSVGKNSKISIPMVIVGNKADLVADRVVDTSELRKFTDDVTELSACCGVEVSAKENRNVEDIFLALFNLAKLPSEMTPSLHRNIPSTYNPPGSNPGMVRTGSNRLRPPKETGSNKEEIDINIKSPDWEENNDENTLQLPSGERNETNNTLTVPSKSGSGGWRLMSLRRRISDAYGAVTMNARRPSIRTDLMAIQQQQQHLYHHQQQQAYRGASQAAPSNGGGKNNLGGEGKGKTGGSILTRNRSQKSKGDPRNKPHLGKTLADVDDESGKCVIQ